MLSKQGEITTDVAKWLNESLKGRLVISDCAGSDRPWVQRLFNVSDIAMEFDIVDVLTYVDKPNRKLFEEKFRYFKSQHYDEDKRHRAGYDAKVIRVAYLETMELIDFINEQSDGYSRPNKEVKKRRN